MFVFIFLIILYSTTYSYSSDIKILSLEEAQNQILDDNLENFFSRLNNRDIKIQMKLTKNKANPSLAEFKEYIKSEADEFNEEEKVILKKVFGKILKNIKKLNSKLLPDYIGLFSVKNNHYGKHVFYTREENIVFPKKSIKDTKNFEQTMVHLIWHIISKHQRKFSDSVYNIFGYKKDCIGGVKFDSAIKNKLILDPDGNNLEYIVTTKKGDKLITNMYSKWEYHGGVFLDYTKTGLFLVKDCFVSEQADKNLFKDYFEITSSNSIYVLNHDEFIAENFKHVYYINFDSSYKTNLLDMDKLKKFETLLKNTSLNYEIDKK